MPDRHHIITLPHTSLRQPSKEVSEVNPKIEKIINDMEDATLDWEDSRQHEFGVALAAVQIDQPYRIVIVRRDLNNKDNKGFDVYINPEITRYEGEPDTDYEGCLSIKDVYGKVPRYPKVKVKAKNLEGRIVKFIAKGFMARVFQHEIDHTNGITFADRIGTSGEYCRITESGEMLALSKPELVELIKDLDLA